jgi:ribosome-associated protein
VSRRRAYAPGMPQDIELRGESIRLGQLLKVAGAIGVGGEAKAYLAEHRVLVNGEPEARRGRQLRAGDEIRLGDDEIRLVASS